MSKKIRQKPYHIDSFLKHNFLVQVSMVFLLVVGIISNRYLPNFWSSFNLLAISIYLASFAPFVWASWLIEPYNRFHPTRNVAVEGPYRYSRNPQTIAITVMLIATALVSGSFIILGTVVPLFAYMAFLKIPAEEHQLKARFGKDYENYCSKTRRWL